MDVVIIIACMHGSHFLPYNYACTICHTFSDRIHTDLGCKNLFVDVQYNFSASTFICNFLNQMDTSIKYCSIVYGDCDQWQTQIARGNSTPGAPNTVTLTVMISGGSVCYTAEASNGSFTLVVEGRVQSKCRPYC